MTQVNAAKAHGNSTYLTPERGPGGGIGYKKLGVWIRANNSNTPLLKRPCPTCLLMAVALRCRC